MSVPTSRSSQNGSAGGGSKMNSPQITGALTAAQIASLNSGANYGPPAGAAFPDGPFTVASGTAVDVSGGPDATSTTGFVLLLTTETLSALAGQSIALKFANLAPITITAANFFSSSAEGFPSGISGIANGAVNNIKFDASDSQHAAVVIDFGSALVKGADLGAVTITSPINLRIDVFGENGGIGGHIVDNAANSGGEGITGALLPQTASFS